MLKVFVSILIRHNVLSLSFLVISFVLVSGLYWFIKHAGKCFLFLFFLNEFVQYTDNILFWNVWHNSSLKPSEPGDFWGCFFLSVCVRMVSMLEYDLHIVKFTLSINMMSCVNHSQDKEHMSISKHHLVAAGSQSPPTYLSF